jgi:hypothetical protein
MRSPKDSRSHMRTTPKLAKTSAALSGRQTQASSEGRWNPEQRDEWPGSGLCAGEALESLVPGQAGMGTLCTGEHDRRRWGRGLDRGEFNHLHSLAIQHLHAGSALCSAWPVPRSRSGVALPWRGCEPHTHPARMLGLVAMPLTLRTLRASATVGDPGLIDDAQPPVLLPTAFLWEEPLSCWARYRPI